MLASVSETLDANRDKIRRIAFILTLLLFGYLTLSGLLSNLTSLRFSIYGDDAPFSLVAFFAVLRAPLNAAVTTLQYAGVLWLAVQCVRQWEKPPLQLSGGARGWFWFCAAGGLLYVVIGLVAFFILIPKSLDQPRYHSYLSVFSPAIAPALGQALASLLLAWRKRIGFLALLAGTLFPLADLLQTGINLLFTIAGFTDLLENTLTLLAGLTGACAPAGIAWLVIRKTWGESH